MIKKRGIGEEEGLWKSRCPFTKVLGERVNAHLPWVQHTEKFWYIFPNVSNLNALLHHITHTQDKIGVLSLQLVIRKGHFSSDDKLCAWNVNSPVSVSQFYSLLDVRTFVSPGSMYSTFYERFALSCLLQILKNALRTITTVLIVRHAPMKLERLTVFAKMATSLTRESRCGHV